MGSVHTPLYCCYRIRVHRLGIRVHWLALPLDLERVHLEVVPVVLATRLYRHHYYRIFPVQSD